MSLTIAHYLDMMTQNDNDFFKELGHKIATLRKEQQITQVQLAEILGISQQYMQAFEAGRRKIPSSMLPTLAEVLAVSVEELIGIATTQNKKRGPAPKLLKQIEQISQLPKTKQKFVMDMLDTVIQQQT